MEAAAPVNQQLLRYWLDRLAESEQEQWELDERQRLLAARLHTFRRKLRAFERAAADERMSPLAAVQQDLIDQDTGASKITVQINTCHQ